MEERADGQRTMARTVKVQLMMSRDELRAIDDWRFPARIGSRAAAIRLLVRRGLETAADAEPTSGRAPARLRRQS